MSAATEPVYLDHNASTPVAPEVLEAMVRFVGESGGNPSSGHASGRLAREALERARAEVAELIGARPAEVIFTSGGTEASNLAIVGTALGDPRRHLVTTTIEHPATAAPCAWLEGRGWRVTRVAPGATGRIDAGDVAAALTADTALVTLIHAHNETGALQPVADVARAARGRGVRVHADAAQSVGKIPVDVGALGVDLLSVAGHKLYAPKGIGALWIREGVELEPILRGGGQERGLRPGTENVAGAVGLGAACALAGRLLEQESRRQRDLTERLWQALSQRVHGLVRPVTHADHLPNTLLVCFPGVRGQAVLEHAPAVLASTGSACHAGEERPPTVLLEMGLDATVALGAVRLTLGRATTPAHIDRAAHSLAQAWGQANS